jgi:hypothetical protein
MCSTDRCLSGAIKSLLRVSHAKSGISRAGHVAFRHITSIPGLIERAAIEG